jgi:cell division protein FtsI (penicillin-binding protein 3)
LGGGLTLVFLLLAGRLAQIQIRDRGRYDELFRQQTSFLRTRHGRRGSIYDSQGRILAISTPKDSVFADPAVIDKPRATALLLARSLKANPSPLYRRLLAQNKRFVWVKRRITPSESNWIKKLGLKGVHIRQEHHRVYPTGHLCSHVVGFSDIDGRGLSGIEHSLDAILRGGKTSEVLLKDARGNIFARDIQGNAPTAPVRNGYDVYLTIDSRIQNITRQALQRQFQRHRPEAAWALVMNARTGAVLAMVNLPDFNPNRIAESSPNSRRNRIITDTYEYGSVMKPFTVAAALEAGVISPDTEIECHNGKWRIGARTISDVKEHDTLTASEVVIYSSNIGAAHIGLKLGVERFYKALTMFGFGETSDIHLPGEVTGILRPPERWNKHSLLSISFGKEITNTALSLATAYTVFANEGLLIRPHIIQKIADPDTGEVVYNFDEPVIIRRVTTPETASQVMEMLKRVVEEGTGRGVRLDSYAVAGKTGTSALLSRSGQGYSDSRYLSSFIGIAPADDPRIIALVSLKAPSEGGHYGSTVAGPACRKIIKETLQILGVPPRINPKLMAEVEQ